MTYQGLFDALKVLTEEQLQSDVTIYDMSEDEYYPVNDISFTIGGSDVLDDNHPILIVKEKA